MERFYDVAVMGAGPSGLAAAITVKMMSPDLSVVILEKKEKPAKNLGRRETAGEICLMRSVTTWKASYGSFPK